MQSENDQIMLKILFKNTLVPVSYGQWGEIKNAITVIEAYVIHEKDKTKKCDSFTQNTPGHNFL